MSTPTIPAPAVCYTVTMILMVNGIRHKHIAARNLSYIDALALADAYIEHGYDAWITEQPTTPFTVWQQEEH